MLLQQSETEDPYKYLTLLYRVLLLKFVIIRVMQKCPLAGRGIRMYSIVVNTLNTGIDLSYEYIVCVTQTTHTAYHDNTSWYKVLENLRSLRCPTFYGTWWLITIFTKAR
jgi:hypothetical protein